MSAVSRGRWLACACPLLLGVPAPARAEAVELWVRASGPSASSAPPRTGVTSVELTGAAVQEVERFDAQYGRRLRFRGVPLRWLLEQVTVPLAVDTALLHFQNGMLVPVPFRDAAAMERLSPFVAVAVWGADAAGEEGWRSELPDLPKKGEESADWRPIRFRGNKLVVQTLWHPGIPRPVLAVFSPWQHVDRLVGVELVRADAYQRQFQPPGPPAVAQGARIYAERCQFCHGVNRVGATFGWDFAVPIPLHTHRDPKSLFLHAKYREANAAERGLMMPAFSDLGMPQAEQLWAWMEAIVAQGPGVYAPPSP
ncbi:MAG TPA: cytochrome c [Myxococcaceae bacterium]|nr:cytochrome c [Myxococcaceae bacterium]